MQAVGSTRDRPLRVGIAGLGTAALNVLPELTAHPRVQLTGAADPRPAAREAFAAQFGGEIFESAEALCASSSVDAVYILTPNRMHAEHAILAAEHGKHVLCDKPMATSLEDCDRMIAAAERAGVRLLVGHSQSLDAPILQMARIAGSGELGRPLMVSTSFYSDWLYRPRSPEELDPSLGEGLVMRQGPVQVDIVRMLGGGLGRSVKGIAAVGDPNRRIDGSYAAFMDFQNGVAASLVYSSYSYFDSTEFTFGVGLQGFTSPPDLHAHTQDRFRSFARPEDEWEFKESSRFGGTRAGGGTTPGEKRHAFFGLTILTCERGDVRQTPTGLRIHDANGRRELPVDAGEGFSQRYTTRELDLMVDAWANDTPLALHDGVWAKGTVEVCLAIHESTREQREVPLRHQSPYRG